MTCGSSAWSSLKVTILVFFRECLEYFGKFYEDGGKTFKPLMADTKYVDITK